MKLAETVRPFDLSFHSYAKTHINCVVYLSRSGISYRNRLLHQQRRPCLYWIALCRHFCRESTFFLAVNRKMKTLVSQMTKIKCFVPEKSLVLTLQTFCCFENATQSELRWCNLCKNEGANRKVYSTLFKKHVLPRFDSGAIGEWYSMMTSSSTGCLSSRSRSKGSLES